MSNDLKTAIYLNNKKYIYVSDDAAGKTIASDGSTVVTIKFREAATYSYTVNTKAGDATDLLTSGTTLEGDAVTVPFSQYVLKGTTLYNIAAGSSDWYRVTFTPTANNYVHNLNYNGATIPNVVFFSEGENVAGVSVGSNPTRASNGQMGYTANENTYKEVTTLAPGRYKIFGRGVNGNSAARTANFKLGESTTVWSFNIPNGVNTLGNSEEFDANNEVLSFASTGSSASGLDWLYIQRTGDAPAPAILAKKAELSGNLNENISAKLEGNTLTIKALKDGFGITKVKLLASELGTVTANAGTVEKGVWTGNAKEVVLTLDGTDLNSVSINGALVPEGTGAATISEFKTAANADYLTLSGADILDFPAEGGVIVQDDEAGILLNITLPAITGKKITGKVYGTYADDALVSSDYTDCTQPNTSAGNWREPKEMTVEDAIKAANVYRLVVLKGVTIDENNDVFTATDKTGAVITVNPAMLTLVKGDVLASLTGITYPDGKMKATNAQSGLLWKADDIAAGQSLPVNMTDAAYVSKLADVAMGDVIAIETQGAGTLDVQNAAGQSIVKLEMTQDEDKTLHFPVTADVVSDIQKHGLVLAGEGLKAVMAYKVPGMYAANMNENTIWYSNDVFAQSDRVTLGAIHFPDVREGDKLENKVLTSMDATFQQDNPYVVVSVNAVVDFEKVAVRDDKAEAKEGQEYSQNDYQSTNGMLMHFGGLTPTTAYSFNEAYPAVNKFAAVTEGIDKFPVDDDNKAYDPAQKNVPTQGTFYVFSPTKDGVVNVTVDLEKGKKLYVTENGEALGEYMGITEVPDNTISFSVKAGNTYHLFANETNLKYYGFTFTPNDPTAMDVANCIDIFKKLGDVTAKLMLDDAVVTYIKGDQVIVEDGSGAILFDNTRMQFYVGQKLNGYIIGQNVKDFPVLLRTNETPNSQFKAEKGTAQSQTVTVAEAKLPESVLRFVTLKNLILAKDDMGFRILLDQAGDTIYIEDGFNVLYELPNKIKRIEGIIGFSAENSKTYIWPTSKDAIVPAGVPATLATGKYYLKNVGSGLFWGAGNDWGTRGSLVKHAEFVTLHDQGDGIYKMESQVSNGGTAYYFEGDYMDNANPMSLSINKTKTEGVYTIASPDEKLFGYDGTSTVLGKNVADGENAQWQIISEDEMKATLDAATADNGVDATFLILDPNFGRNNRNVGAWTMANEGVAYNLSGGNNINNCAESYMSTFVLAQEVTVPNGKYVLNAQAAVTFHDDRVIKDYDGNGYPQITANDQVSDFKEMETDDRLSNMGRLSEQFTAGKYAVEPITVYVTDGKLTIGAKSERNDIWAIWDNFELTYYGPAAAPVETARVWDFTQWSAATVDNLKADAAASKTSGWSDVEKKADAEADAEPTEASKDKCFWFAGTVDADGELTANGVKIAETKGLKFYPTYAANRSLAIAVEYPETSLGTYAGPSYLWLGGGKNSLAVFTIPNVTAGSTITVEVESHKPSDARGIELYSAVGSDDKVVADSKIGDSFTPKTKESYSWTIENDGDVTIYNTNGCHLYTLKVEPVQAKQFDVTYALAEGETHASAETVSIKDETGEEVATLTFGEAGGADFKAAKADAHVEGFAAFTEGNGQNGEKTGGTFYIFKPAYDGKADFAIVLNSGKKFYIEEDGTALDDYNGITVDEKKYGTFTCDVKAGSTYKVYCAGSKLGFYGVRYYNTENPVTAIEQAPVVRIVDDAVYNLRGQKVTGTLKPGLYIKNGKKIVIR